MFEQGATGDADGTFFRRGGITGQRLLEGLASGDGGHFVGGAVGCDGGFCGGGGLGEGVFEAEGGLVHGDGAAFDEGPCDFCEFGIDLGLHGFLHFLHGFADFGGGGRFFSWDFVAEVDGFGFDLHFACLRFFGGECDGEGYFWGEFRHFGGCGIGERFRVDFCLAHHDFWRGELEFFACGKAFEHGGAHPDDGGAVDEQRDGEADPHPSGEVTRVGAGMVFGESRHVEMMAGLLRRDKRGGRSFLLPSLRLKYCETLTVVSHSLPERPLEPLNLPETAGFRVAVVASLYNPQWVDALVRHFLEEMAVIVPRVVPEVFRVPGSYEIPIAVQSVLERRKPHVVATFGVILAGETSHADLISTAVTRALMDLSLEHRVPVLHEVLCVENERQAEERCLHPELNRGVEAARAACRVVSVMREIAG